MPANVSTDGATALVLVPGAGTDPRVYEATIAALRELGHEGIAPPLPLDDAAATPSDTPMRSWPRSAIRRPCRWSSSATRSAPTPRRSPPPACARAG